MVLEKSKDIYGGRWVLYYSIWLLLCFVFFFFVLLFIKNVNLYIWYVFFFVDKILWGLNGELFF